MTITSEGERIRAGDAIEVDVGEGTIERMIIRTVHDYKTSITVYANPEGKGFKGKRWGLIGLTADDYERVSINGKEVGTGDIKAANPTPAESGDSEENDESDDAYNDGADNRKPSAPSSHLSLTSEQFWVECTHCSRSLVANLIESYKAVYSRGLSESSRTTNSSKSKGEQTTIKSDGTLKKKKKKKKKKRESLLTYFETILSVSKKVKQAAAAAATNSGPISIKPFLALTLCATACFLALSFFLGQQYSNMCKNITTNERMNASRYPWHQDDNGRFLNRFDTGSLAKNLAEF